MCTGDIHKYPILPLRDIVIFPNMIVPLFVGRNASVRALESVLYTDKKILLVTQKNQEVETPSEKDLYKVGTIGGILQLLKMPDGTVKVLVEGYNRATVGSMDKLKGFLAAEATQIIEVEDETKEIDALMRTLASQFEQYSKLNRKIPIEAVVSVIQLKSPVKLSDTIAAHLPLRVSDKQNLLETGNVQKRLEKLLSFLESEIELLQIEAKIKNRVKKQIERSQRDYYLNEQIKAIQKELGEGGELPDEIQEIEDKLQKTRLSAEAREKANSELKKLRQMSPMSAEAAVIRNYLDWLIALPWSKPKFAKIKINEAKVFLNKQHYGLDKVKDRIIEYISVLQRVKKVNSQILCFVGPPGVGKTSLAKSIAEATGRNFVKVSLGGVRDEAEIRGHRRTYIGAMPGRIIQGMKKAKTTNPLFLLDEIDKLGSDWRGDPTSALLEVLDPEQNSAFNDHYMEVDYDLSNVMFVTTANTLNLPGPLLDRMEVIRISGYTEDEKFEIAKRHLIDKQRKIHGLKKKEFILTDSGIIKEIIRSYTNEAGVRGLEREIAKIARKITRQLVEANEEPISSRKTSKNGLRKGIAPKISKANLNMYLGAEKYRHLFADKKNMVGVTNGLAWTEVGGELLSIEAVCMHGKGKSLFTGKLGDVMQESIQAALSFVRYQAGAYGIDENIFEKTDIHIHVPEGATPKDGPSAGIAMVTSMVSVLTGVPVRKDVAMTGEITLRGRVLAIGGLKEKLLAALRGGIKKAIIPKENEKDLPELPDRIKNELKIICVENADEALSEALVEFSAKPILRHGISGRLASAEIPIQQMM
ncbi:MAG: endopeptidase La [Holosporales bacterium]|jgi:ATP-dependent Lon protease|nr:endopeptidase La [Holosporales bacterium]